MNDYNKPKQVIQAAPATTGLQSSRSSVSPFAIYGGTSPLPTIDATDAAFEAEREEFLTAIAKSYEAIRNDPALAEHQAELALWDTIVSDGLENR